MTAPSYNEARETFCASDITIIDVSVSDFEVIEGGSTPDYFRGFMVGTAGDLTIVTLEGRTRTIPANCIAVGIIHPIAGTCIKNSGTTAAQICVVF